MTVDPEDIPRETLLEYKRLYDSGQENMSHSNYQQAIDCFLEAVRLTRPCEVIWGNIALCYLHLNDSERCIDALRRSLEVDPDYRESLHNLALMLSDAKELSEAESLIRRAIAIDGTEAHSWSTLGRILRAQGRHKEAMRALATALGLEPDHVNAHHHLGLVFIELEENDRAERSFLKAVQLAPDHADILLDFGRFLILMQRFRDAQIYLRRAIEADPFDNMPLVCLAEALIYQAKEGGEESALTEMVDEAHALLNRSFKIDPFEGKAWFHWAEGAVFYREWNAVEEFCRKSIELGYEENLWVFALLSAALGKLGRAEEATEMFQEYRRRVDRREKKT